ncbi:hypothetical protein NYE80_25835 [Paenibacillus sp. FSL H7-0357]|uniref:hypothetical protein n=1 Tax=Paenibacillus sp. FSL H7-0357 TaxID=1536774 RepID=UPI0012DFF1F9|nr:hypothetical protein [Paenibacillus sp. FSL H7-0357]
MSTTYKVLENDIDFLTAALAQSKVSVWYREDPDPNGHLIDYGGGSWKDTHRSRSG